MGIGILYGLSAASIWGGMYVVSKVVLEVVPPFTLLTVRLILGMATLGVVLVFKGWREMERGGVIQALGVGLVGYGLPRSFHCCSGVGACARFLAASSWSRYSS